MDCNGTCTKQYSCTGFTLPEVMVAVMIGSILITALMLLAYSVTRSCAALDNYLDLELKGQQGLDAMTREVRQARQVTAFASNDVSLVDGSGSALRYFFDANSNQLLRVSGGRTNVMMSGCETVQFAIFQHTPISNTFDCYDPAYTTNAKLLQVSWVASRTIMGAKVNSDAVESAKIVIRNN